MSTLTTLPHFIIRSYPQKCIVDQRGVPSVLPTVLKELPATII